MTRMKKFFTTIDHGETLSEGVGKIGSTAGILAYSTIALFNKKLTHEVPVPEVPEPVQALNMLLTQAQAALIDDDSGARSGSHAAA